MKKKNFLLLIRIVILFIIPLNFINNANSKEKTDATLLPYQLNLDPDIIHSSLRRTAVDIEKGDVWVWGQRNYGLQGNGKYGVNSKKPPAKVEFFSKNQLVIISLVAGERNIVALDNKGQVWGWGQDNRYQASAGNQNCKSLPGNKVKSYISTPCQIQIPEKVIQLSNTRDSVYALTGTGDVYSWGRNTYGQIGNGTKGVRSELYKIPSSSFGNERIRLIGGAYRSGYAITESGKIYAWGHESMYAFGRKTRTSYIKTPEKVNIVQENGTIIDGRNVKFIGGGYQTTFLLKTDGSVWGLGRKSRLGQGVNPNNEGDTSEEECLAKNDGDTTADDNDDNDREHGDDELDVVEECASESEMEDLESSSRTKTAEAVHIKFGNNEKVKTLYTRYTGSFAVTQDNNIYTWGYNGTKKGYYIYGLYPVKRDHINGELSKVIGGKQNIIYWNKNGEGYGVGYSRLRKFAMSGDKLSVDWPGIRLDMVTNEMKKEYGEDFIPGQTNSFY